MDQQTQTILENYAKLFSTTFSAETDEQRKNAEKEILASSQQDPKFLEHLVLLLVHQETPNPIKQSASVYIHTFTRYFSATEHFKEERKRRIVEIYFDALLEPKIQVAYKKPIVNSLSLVLQFDQDNSIKTAMYEKIVSLLKENQREKYIGCFMSIQPLVSATRSPKHLEPMSVNIIQLISDAILQIVTPLGQKFLEMGQTNAIPDQVILNEIKDCLQITQIWAQTFKAFLSKFSETDKSDYKLLMKQLTLNNKVALIFMQILQLQLPNPQQIKDCLVSTCGIKEIDTELNELKTQIIKAYSKINKFSFNNRGQIDIKVSVFFQMLSQILPQIMGSTYNFCQFAQQNLFKCLENEQIESLIVECLSFLKNCGGQQEFYPVFSSNKQQLVLNVILPLMRSSPEEIEKFEDSPEDFVHLALDTCDKQLSETSKTAASQVLEILCDNIDGATTLIGSLCLSTIRYALYFIYNPNEKPEVATLSNQYPALADSWESIFLKHSSHEILIETCFLALSVMSYMVPKRNDIVQEIELLLKQNAQFLFQQNSTYNLIKVRLCLFLGYYSDTIFQGKEDQAAYQEIIQYLIQCTQQKDIESISLQAIDSLINIYDEEELSERLTTTITPVFQHLIQQITVSESTQFLDLIQTITQSFSTTLKDNLSLILECVKHLVERVKSEFEKLQKKERTTQLYINKCWNIIRSIADNDYYVPAIADEMEVQLSPLLIALQTPEQIEFDDDILLTITSFLKKKQCITQGTSALLPFFPGVFKKQTNVFGHMFQTLNYVIEYGENYFNSRTPEVLNVIQMIIELSLASMHDESKRTNEADNAEGATLIQMLIIKYSHLITDEQYTNIFSQSLARLAKQPKNSFLSGRILGIFLQSFQRQFDKTQTILQDHLGQLQAVMQAILNKCDNYTTNFDVKVFVQGCSHILLQDNMNQVITQHLPQILDFIVTLLKKQEQVENKKKNNQFQAQLDSDDDDDDDNFDSDDEENFKYADDEILQDKMTLDYMVCPLLKEDEFELFRKVIHSIKERNQEILMNFVNTLADNKKDFLKHVLSIQRIQVGENKNVARRIVKRKK